MRMSKLQIRMLYVALFCILATAAFISLQFLLSERDTMDNEQCVIVNFKDFKQNTDEVFDLQDRLTEAVESAGIGECDGNELAVDGSDGSYFFYGPDADRIAWAILPLLKESAACRDAVIYLRYGPPEDGVPEKVVKISDLK